MRCLQGIDLSYVQRVFEASQPFASAAAGELGPALQPVRGVTAVADLDDAAKQSLRQHGYQLIAEVRQPTPYLK